MIPADLRARLTAAGCPDYPADAPVRLAAWAAVDALRMATGQQNGGIVVACLGDREADVRLVYTSRDGKTVTATSHEATTLSEAVTLAWERWAEVRRD